MVINCPVCGKLTCIHWPEHWIHRRGATFYCSDNCLQVDLVKDTKLLNSSLKRRKSKVKAIVNEEQRKHAVEIALSGGDPRPFLSDCGSKNPEKLWSDIRIRLRKTDPVTYDKLPARIHGAKPGPKPKTAGDAMIAMKEAADNFFSQCEDMGLKMETPTVKVDGPIRIETKEPEKVEIVESPEHDNDYLFTTAAVRNKRLGTFYYDDKHGTIDWRHPCGEEIILSADDYKLLWYALPEILRSLGVGL